MPTCVYTYVVYMYVCLIINFALKIIAFCNNFQSIYLKILFSKLFFKQKIFIFTNYIS